MKRALAVGATSSAPPDLPVEPETHAPFLRLVTRGAEEADEAELARNPRSQVGPPPGGRAHPPDARPPA